MKNFNRHSRDDGRGFGGRDGGRPSMHPAICDECGKNCEVPFKPTGDKPIYCNDCFGNHKTSDAPRRGNQGGGRSSFRDKQMFSAVCDKCGKKCEVPFKPSGDKPIYCNDCFGQNRDAGSKNSGPSKEQFEIINSKLDKILKALAPAVKETTEVKTNKAVVVLPEKKADLKKAAKKKPAVVAPAKTKNKKKL